MTPPEAGFRASRSGACGRRVRARGEVPRVVEGEQVLGRFTIGERIGGGGHGTVHRGWDERLCRSVAVKSVEGGSAERVLREAHAAARLNHPGIVTLYELGRQGNRAYLVSELVEGPDLRELALAGALSDREVAEIGAELCAALAHAHAAGVVHRDVKPDNILIRGRGGRFARGSGERAVLADFGIASLDDGQSLTATGQVVGTLAYMSPEQAAGAEAGSATDVYALALTLYELWAGFNPVLRTTPAATARAIGEPLEPLCEMRPELPEELGDAIDACLRADPEDRPTLAPLRESLLSVRGALHPDRAVPEPVAEEVLSTLPPELPVRPFAVLVAAGALAIAGTIAGLPGLALVGAVLVAPAALLLARPGQWFLPALAPLLGLAGAAPAFLAVAARCERFSGRIALAALGWAWTGVAGALIGRGLGVGGGAASEPAGWAGSGSTAMGEVLTTLLEPTALALGLIWVGSAVLLGALLDVARPAGAAVGGLIWSACVVAAVAAAGPQASASFLLAPALLAAVGWAIWDAAGRPALGSWLPTAQAPRGLLGLFDAGAGLAAVPAPPRPPRNPADVPLADERIRATRAAAKHVRAALHQAGSGPGLP